MVHFKHSQISGIRVTVSKRVEAGAENDVLRHVLLNGLGQLVFGVPAAGHQKGAEGDGQGFMEPGGGLAQLFRILAAEDRDRERILQDQGAGIVDLVRGPAEGYAEGSAGWAGFFHWIGPGPPMRKKRVWRWPGSCT